MTTVLRGARIVLPSRVVDGSVRVAGQRIVAVQENSGGHMAAPGDVVVDLDGGYLVPAYIDVHCHGGGGHDFGTAAPDGVALAAAMHAGHGSGAMLASLVTAPIDALCEQMDVLADVIESGSTGLVGIHLEGPYLSAARCGAQNPQFLARPEIGTFAALLEAGRGWLRMLTIAPELSGADEVIDAAIEAGVTVAVGHTDATYEQARWAFSRGARVATHLFNGMRPMHHREPGPVLAALDSGAICEVINDGIHVHPAIAGMVSDRDPKQLVLMTDAISAAGVGDGSFELGGQEITVSHGVARLRGSGSLAGSTLTMDAAVRRAVVESGLPLEQAVAAATLNPARLLGVDQDLGSLGSGRRADLLHLDAELHITRRMRAGVWLD